MGTDRIRNLGLNAAIGVFGVIVLVLGWSLVGGWVGVDAPGGGSSNGHEIVQLDVRNGCGESGLAATMADFLRDEGLDVLEAGDWTRFDVQKTFAVDRIGDDAPGRAVLRILDLDEDRLRKDIRTDYYLDVTLVIGCDYASLPPFRDED